MPRIKIPTAFRKHTDGQREIELAKSNVGELLAELIDRHPHLSTHLFDDQGQLLSFVNVFVNDENIRDLDGNETPVSDRDQVFLVPAMAGG